MLALLSTLVKRNISCILSPVLRHDYILLPLIMQTGDEPSHIPEAVQVLEEKPVKVYPASQENVAIF